MLRQRCWNPLATTESVFRFVTSISASSFGWRRSVKNMAKRHIERLQSPNVIFCGIRAIASFKCTAAALLPVLVKGCSTLFHVCVALLAS